MEITYEEFLKISISVPSKRDKSSPLYTSDQKAEQGLKKKKNTHLQKPDELRHLVKTAGDSVAKRLQSPIPVHSCSRLVVGGVTAKSSSPA
jgi:hypothetical protein